MGKLSALRAHLKVSEEVEIRPDELSMSARLTTIRASKRKGIALLPFMLLVLATIRIFSALPTFPPNTSPSPQAQKSSFLSLDLNPPVSSFVSIGVRTILMLSSSVVVSQKPALLLTKASDS